MKIDDEAILTLTQFAKKLQICRQTVIKMIDDGIIQAFRLTDIEGSHYRIKESEIHRLVEYRIKKVLELKKTK